MIDTYRESKTYPVNANDSFAYCLNAVKTIGAEVESSDRELGIIHAGYYSASLVFAGNIGIYLLIAPDGERASQVAIEAYVTYSGLVRFPPAGKPKKVAQRILSRVGDAVALAKETKLNPISPQE